jgi:hypothetical protein
MPVNDYSELRRSYDEIALGVDGQVVIAVKKKE